MRRFDTLKELRQEHGLTLKEVGDAVGVSASYIWYIEQGRRTTIALPILKGLAGFYHITLDELQRLMEGGKNDVD